MRLTSARFFGLTLPLCLALAVSPCRSLPAQEPGVGVRSGASFWQAAAGVVFTNWVTWGYNRYVQRWPWSKVGLNSWGKNLRQVLAHVEKVAGTDPGAAAEE